MKTPLKPKTVRTTNASRTMVASTPVNSAIPAHTPARSRLLSMRRERLISFISSVGPYPTTFTIGDITVPPLKPPGPSGEGVEGDPEKTLTFVTGGTETPTEEVPETYTTGIRADGQLLLAPKISPKARKAFRILSATSTGSSPAACSSCVV